MTAQDAAEFVAGLQSVLDQYAHAMLHIGQGFTLQAKAEILAVTQGPLTKARDLWRTGKASSGQEAETVIARAPEWDTDHAMPASWALPGVRLISVQNYPASCMSYMKHHAHDSKRPVTQYIQPREAEVQTLTCASHASCRVARTPCMCTWPHPWDLLWLKSQSNTSSKAER